jgi:hypothetical protein
MRTSSLFPALIPAVLAIAGCGTPMRESAKRIRVGKEIPHPGCRELGPIIGTGGGGGYTSSETKMNTAQNKLRMRTEDLGGDYAVMDAVGGDVRGLTITGRAFDCSRAAPQQVVPVAVVGTAQGGESAPANALTAEGTADATTSLSVKERLERLEKLKADGLISQEEFAAKRRAILDEL